MLFAANPFKEFTGKVTGNRVRLRLEPSLDGHIAQEKNKNDLLVVVGEHGDFYAVEPPLNQAAYVFRSYILDQLVEADRVNVRLKPTTNSPIIGKLEKGMRVYGKPCTKNHKWLEIRPPANVRFYVAKDYIKQIGTKEYFAHMHQKKENAQKTLRQAFSLSLEEGKKAFSAMKPERAIQQFEHVIRDFTDFPALVEQAKVGLVEFKDLYTQKKIAYLEDQVDQQNQAHEIESADPFTKFTTMLNDENLANPKKRKKLNPKLWNETNDNFTGFTSLPNSRYWESVENSLYTSWVSFNEEKKMSDFYDEQLANAIELEGVIVHYDMAVQNKPGEFLLKKDSMPVAYLYSTQVDLKKHLGKKIKAYASPRPNNHFAFPAYFILNIE